jgi:hypothetical protein
MAWKKIPGLEGRVYIPEEEWKTPRKHGCRDCFSCQMCSDDRCRLCDDRKYPEKQIIEIQDKGCKYSEKNPCSRKNCGGLE